VETPPVAVETLPGAVVFDLGGVVFRYAPERRLAAFARLTGTPPDTLRKRFIGSGYAMSCDAGRLQGEAAYREGIRLLGQRISYQRFRSLWISAFEPDPAVVALAQQLKPRVPLALLSNNSQLVREGLEARYPEVMALFRPSLFSADAGRLKPDPGLFHTLLDLLAQPPARTFYVDDDPATVAAAAALGLDAHRFSTPELLARLLSERGLLDAVGG
jgi:HAD superfamily hydrolase (TIGR01509 family)